MQNDGFERAAIMQERNTGTAIQEHGLNTYTAAAKMSKASLRNYWKREMLLCPFKSMGQPYTETAAGWSRPSVMTKGLQLLSRLGLHLRQWELREGYGAKAAQWK